MYNMLDQYFVKKSVFSFWLNRNPEEENGVNLFLEVLIPITTRESTLMCLCQEKVIGSLIWEIYLLETKKTGICADSCSAITDLGTSLLAGPTELEFIHKSSSTVGYRPNVFSTTLSNLIATNSYHFLIPHSREMASAGLSGVLSSGIGNLSHL
ncbi:aspartic proteinase-like [Arachis stenosperma]|uniref:aspartic proteinase-like n=1 Tax=Arachis stenosperma TaxID=217475 RepID=UPI0025ACAEF7|nr:aspartic proteinase-like [Arachis stenosperma]